MSSGGKNFFDERVWEEIGVDGTKWGMVLTVKVFFVTILEPLLGIGNKPVLGRRTLSRRCRRYG